MKRFVILLMTISVIGTDGANSADSDTFSVSWYDLASAQKLANDLPKPLFIEFTAKWCGWCKKMDKTTFSDERVIELLNQEYYAVRVDFDSLVPVEYQGKTYTGKELAKHFGIEGLPTMIYIPSDQKRSLTIVGYKTAKQLTKELNKLNDS